MRRRHSFFHSKPLFHDKRAVSTNLIRTVLINFA
jgi:hypothetical protein